MSKYDTYDRYDRGLCLNFRDVAAAYPFSGEVLKYLKGEHVVIYQK